MASRRYVRHSPLDIEDKYDESKLLKEDDLRFKYTPKALGRVPWKSIFLVLFLLCLGSTLLLLALFVIMGHMDGDQAQAYGLLVVGILAFLPRFYETRIAYYSWGCLRLANEGKRKDKLIESIKQARMEDFLGDAAIA